MYDANLSAVNIYQDRICLHNYMHNVETVTVVGQTGPVIGWLVARTVTKSSQIQLYK